MNKTPRCPKCQDYMRPKGEKIACMEPECPEYGIEKWPVEVEKEAWEGKQTVC